MASYPAQGTDPWWTPLQNFLGVALNTSTGALNTAAVSAGLPALTGDITTSAGAVATTLKNTGSAGTYGDATHVPQFTTDTKGRITAVTSVTITGTGGTDSGWIAVTFTNSWNSAVGATSYRKIGNEVFLRGGISGGSNGSSAFTLPSGYRPTQQVTSAVAQPGGSGLPFVAIATSGTVSPTFAAGTGAVYLDNVRFLVN